MLKFECKMRCRHCKEKFTPKFFNQKFHLDKLECIAAFNEWVKVETEKKNDREWRKEKKVIKEKLKSHADYVKDLQIVFNAYIRERDKSLPCVSCGAFNVEEWHCGHYIPTTYQYLRFNEKNCARQCSKCNTYLRGNLVSYRIELINRIGLDEVEKLEADRHITKKLSIPELIEMRVKYKDKLKVLKN